MREHNWVFDQLSQYYECRPPSSGQPDRGDCPGCGLAVSEEAVREASVRDALPFRSRFETLNWIASHLDPSSC